MAVFCMILGGCADCGKTDKPTDSTGTPVTGDPSVRAQKFPAERHPLAPFIDAGQK
jgi:hypothetical protein